MKVSIGRIVHYKLAQSDVDRIPADRSACNPHHVGQVLPLVVCVVWPNEYGPNYDGVNGQLLLDGSNSLWVTSAKEGEGVGEWSWPKREENAPEAKEAA